MTGFVVQGHINVHKWKDLNQKMTRAHKSRNLGHGCVHAFQNVKPHLAPIALRHYM